jgi:hypothetical protein
MKSLLLLLCLISSSAFAGASDIFIIHHNGFRLIKDADAQIRKTITERGMTIVDSEESAFYKLTLDTTRDPFTLVYETMDRTSFHMTLTETKAFGITAKRAETKTLKKILNTLRFL